MTHQTNNRPAAEVLVKRRQTPSLIWIVPIAAALIAAWLAIKTINDRGPLISIRFDSATGLEAGKTKIRYRDVDIGLVEEIRLDEDLTHVLVRARMDKRATPFLTESARFWIVRARVSSEEVSGLSTLFSGVYIALAPGPEAPVSNRFIGLETPPVLTGDLPGRHFVLKAGELGSLDVGAPVYYRQIQVGRVVSYALDEQGKNVTVRICAVAPHHQLVTADTRFWNADGLQLKTESLLTILSGGIAFATPELPDPSPSAAENTEFSLYPDRRSSLQKDYPLKQRFLLHFNESVRGLTPGAPVEFRGIRIGQVVSVDLEFDMQQQTFNIPVVVELEPNRIKLTGNGQLDAQAIIPILVQRGLRAQLKLVNLLTGQLVVNLNIYPDTPAATIIQGGSYPELPTLPTPLEEIAGTVSRLLKKIDQIPFSRIAEGLEQDLADVGSTLQTLDATLLRLQQLLHTLDSEVAPSATETIETLRQTLQTLQHNFAADSPLSTEASRALEEFSKAARSVRDLTDTLERHPEALLRGKKGYE
ncbi:MAG: MlaD family protein [Desulfuromonadaceae bacterium]